jgi:PhnB protein
MSSIAATAKKAPSNASSAKRKMLIHPYLCFAGRCDEAVEFYREALGAEVATLMRVKDAPKGSGPGPEMPGDQVLHVALQIGDATVMATDCSFGAPAGFNNFSLTLEVGSPAEAELRFAALADGGQIRQPLAKTFFSPSFGVVADRFGVSWMVMVPA